MSTTGLFAGLPAEFSPPEKAAERIAELRTLAEREAYFIRIPSQWRPFIGDLVPIAIASRIVELPEKAQRQDALASVPDFWRDLVRKLTVSLWQTREIRAAYQAELAAKRDQKEAA